MRFDPNTEIETEDQHNQKEKEDVLYELELPCGFQRLSHLYWTMWGIMSECLSLSDKHIHCLTAVCGKRKKRSHFGPLLSHDLQFRHWPLRHNHTAQRSSRSHTNVVCLYWKRDQIDLQHVQGVPHLSPSACWGKNPTSFNDDIADLLRSTWTIQQQLG